MLKLLSFSVFSLAALVAPIAVNTPAQVAPTADVSLAIAKQVYEAVKSGDYRLAAAFALLLVVAGLRWLAPKLHDKVGDFLNGDIGGSLLVLMAGLGSALTAAHLAGAPWGWGMARTAGEVALTAAGGYSMLKKLCWPLVQKLWGKLFGAPPSAT